MRALKYNLLSIVLLMVSCSNQQFLGKVTFYLWDVTDSTIPNITTNDMLEYSNPEGDAWGSHCIGFQHITDVEYNEQQVYCIDAEVELYSNAILRKKAMETFLNNVREMDIKAKKDTFDYTSAWLPLLKTLEEVSNMEASHKEVVMVTNGLDNNLWIRLPTDSCQQRLFNNPESVIQQYKGHIPEHFSAKNIHLTLVNVPADAQESKVFEKVVEIYKSLLSEYGITVTVRGSL